VIWNVSFPASKNDSIPDSLAACLLGVRKELYKPIVQPVSLFLALAVDIGPQSLFLQVLSFVLAVLQQLAPYGF
jgi:hypothetical protein